MVDFRELRSDESGELRDIRLRALRDSPETFLASYQREVDFDGDRWRAELDRGRWIIGSADGAPVSLLGLIPYAKQSGTEHFIEYMWVAPERRKAGVAKKMLDYVFDHLDDGIERIYLYVLTGNNPAICLYKRVGFVDDELPQPLLEAKPGFYEQKMLLDLKQLRVRRYEHLDLEGNFPVAVR